MSEESIGKAPKILLGTIEHNVHNAGYTDKIIDLKELVDRGLMTRELMVAIVYNVTDVGIVGAEVIFDILKVVLELTLKDKYGGGAFTQTMAAGEWATHFLPATCDDEAIDFQDGLPTTTADQRAWARWTQQIDWSMFKSARLKVTMASPDGEWAAISAFTSKVSIFVTPGPVAQTEFFEYIDEATGTSHELIPHQFPIIGWLLQASTANYLSRTTLKNYKGEWDVKAEEVQDLLPHHYDYYRRTRTTTFSDDILFSSVRGIINVPFSSRKINFTMSTTDTLIGYIKHVMGKTNISPNASAANVVRGRGQRVVSATQLSAPKRLRLGSVSWHKVVSFFLPWRS